MSPSVLLVEDDPSIREITAMGMRAAGYDVVTAADGSEALATFRSRAPDVVILDVMLPRLTGLEVCRSIRAVSDVPVIMLTARTDTPDVIAGLEAGADDYVKKPFDLPELVARVRAALRRVQPADPKERLVLGPVTIDLPGHSVRRDGDDIALSNIEFRLLVELARHRGQVLTREVLLDRVWGYDYLGDSRLVDVAIQRLRTKVERDAAHPALIVTVRGAGYKAAR